MNTGTEEFAEFAEFAGGEPAQRMRRAALRICCGAALAALCSLAAAASAVAGHDATGGAQGYPAAAFAVASAVFCVAVLGTAVRIGRHRSALVHEARQHAALAASRAAAAAGARERERHQRILHDRVLQILEPLARGERRFDTGVRGECAVEAAWLRDLVETGRERPPGNLVAELEALGVGFATQGLRVELNTAGLAAAGNAHDKLSPDRVAALAGATRESLVNVAKHAGTDVATVRATYARALSGTAAPGILVTVVDGGRGFEPEQAQRGQGLRRSIIGQVTEAGGTVLIESATDEGTSVELRMPLG
jgi:anti-sigma regulatory factor (Ser/Thr protein kinase)